MHIDVRNYLTGLEAVYANDPLGFLWEFAPVHEWWHMERMQGTQQIGFLTFHHLVIKSFGSTFPTGQIPVQPSSIAPFPPVLGTAAGSVTDTASLREFSEDLEGWHNAVHNAVGGRFLDPVRNVYQRIFWQFHLFLDGQFESALTAMGHTFNSYFDQVSESDQRDI